MSNYFDNKPVFMEPQVNQYSSHMVMTNVSQESKTKIVNIDTKFRDDYNYDTACNLADYSMSLPEPINNVCSMTVENLELPLTYYNVSSALGNNVFKVTRLSTPPVLTIITVPDGEYTLTSLDTKITNLLNSLGLGLDISIPLTANNTTMNNSSASDDYSIEFAVNKDGSFDKHNFKSKLGWMLGFTEVSYTIPNNGEIVAERISNLTRPRVLYLHVDDFAQTKQNSFSTMMSRSRNSDNIIAKIMVDRSSNDFRKIFFANKANGYLLSDKREYSGKTNIKRLQVQLVDEFDQKINLNGLDFSFSLKIEHL